ncbi:MAG: hypothetical protein Q4G26_10715 [Paracoccus sp. (in: a-proteobacteria)]|nr:hypothetical protein [Paracoccus sp. (in: a-proteobacteria)]
MSSVPRSPWWQFPGVMLPLEGEGMPRGLPGKGYDAIPTDHMATAGVLPHSDASPRIPEDRS